MEVKQTHISCDCYDETALFNRIDFRNGVNDKTYYEINIVDSWCDSRYAGVKGRLKRAWNAFWAKPICFTGVQVEDKEKIRKFFTECLELIDKE